MSVSYTHLDVYKRQAYDEVAIGKSTIVPEMVYGLNLGFEYKGFGVDATFQGISGISTMLTTPHVYRPLRNNNNISTWYLSDRIRWTESTKDIANVPRLSTSVSYTHLWWVMIICRTTVSCIYRIRIL